MCARYEYVWVRYYLAMISAVQCSRPGGVSAPLPVPLLLLRPENQSAVALPLTSDVPSHHKPAVVR